MAWPHCYFSRIALEDIPGIRLGDVPDQFRCTAKAKSTGARCQNPRVKGDSRCRTHGAKTKKLSRAKMLRQAARLRGERPSNYWCD